MNYHEYHVILDMIIFQIFASFINHEVEVYEVVGHIFLPVSLPILCVSMEHININLVDHVNEEISDIVVLSDQEETEHEHFL